MSQEFEWDEDKARRNKTKHRVAFEEAATVFADPLAKIFEDMDHSNGERREIIIGHSPAGRLILVSFVERASAIRIISARSATKKEREDYEENSW